MRDHDIEHGFTLIELVIAVVIVGILTAVAVVGLSGATKSGNNSACSTAVDSVKAAAATYYANTGNYPATSGGAPIGFDLLLNAAPPVLTLPTGVNAAGTVMSASGWSVTMNGGGAATPNGYVKTGGGAACS